MAYYTVLCVDDLRVALPLPVVERVIRAVSVSRLPEAPRIVLGIINVQGRVIPVFDIRRRFGLPSKDIALNNQMVIAQAGCRMVALVTDEVSGIVCFDEPEIVEAESVLPDLDYVAGVLRLDDGMILIHNLDSFLSLEEADVLDRAMSVAAGAEAG